MPILTVIYATGSGHTEYVVQVLEKFLAKKSPRFKLHIVRAEEASLKDFTASDFLILASGTWNTGGVEGQMHPNMYELLKGRAKDLDLKGQSASVIALGDKRYFYTARAGEHLRSYIVNHGGDVSCTPLTIVNEPYGQEERVEKWGEKLLATLRNAELRMQN